MAFFFGMPLPLSGDLHPAFQLPDFRLFTARSRTPVAAYLLSISIALLPFVDQPWRDAPESRSICLTHLSLLLPPSPALLLESLLPLYFFVVSHSRSLTFVVIQWTFYLR